ncbi:ABC transporter substrate-binding protein [Aureimonas sp. AU22]|jgi:iron(III) transport system substrate-binding protein|uniref:ABC transporter substrate-binding protein n=1 Tax=Aureimonas sp. AU22 TaxID=1638162 RepID=UPI000783019F|nr:ABC transporter substrate-binding protein [Aureimonas sp. AU22]
MSLSLGKLTAPLALASALTIAATGAQALTLYTSQPEADAARTVAGFQALHPDTEVQVYRSGTSDVLAKLAAEFASGAPQPDVLLIADALSMEVLKGQGRLAAYPEADLSGFEPATYDKDKFYFGSKLITTGIAYNTGAAEKPAHWRDLENPAYKGMVVMPSPLYSGAAAYLLSGFSADKDLGWSYFEQLKANEVSAVRGNGAVLKSVATGEKPYGILVDFMAMNAKAKGSPIEFVFPDEGVPAVTEPVAILSTAKDEKGAKLFVDYILSDAGQKLALEQGYLPARASVGRPAWLPEGVKVNVMPIDIKTVVERTEKDKQAFSTLFGN